MARGDRVAARLVHMSCTNDLTADVNWPEGGLDRAVLSGTLDGTGVLGLSSGSRCLFVPSVTAAVDAGVAEAMLSACAHLLLRKKC